MNFTDLIDTIPRIIELFLPGFIFLKSFHFFRGTKSKETQTTIIGCIVLSYVFKSVIEVFELSSFYSNLATIILSFIFGCTFARITSLNIFKRALTILGRATGDENIWYSVFNINKGNQVRFSTLYYHQKVIIEGFIQGLNVLDDGSCDLLIMDYSIEFIEGVKTNAPKVLTLYVNSKDIHGLEVLLSTNDKNNGVDGR